MTAYKKIARHFNRIQKHTMTKENQYFSLLRYIFYNIKSRVVKEQTITWIGKLKFYLRKGDAGLVGNVYYGLYEIEESLFLLHLLGKDDVFMDIGANLGHYSLLISGINNCKTIAIEPVPETFKQFSRNIKLNNLEHLIQPLHMGMGDNEGYLYFSTDRNTMDRIVDPSYSPSVKIPVTTIDNIAHNIPTAIKLDVEGYEYFVLKGAEKVLKSATLKVIILELNQSGKKYGIEDDAVYQLLLDSGFRPFKYDFQVRKVVLIDSYNKHKFNTIFIKDVRFVQNRLSKSEQIKVWNMKF